MSRSTYWKSSASLLVILLFSWSAFAAPAPLQDNDDLKTYVKGARVIKQGKFSKLSRVKVKLRDGSEQTIPKLAKKIFVGQARLKSDISRAKMASLVSVDEYGQETDEFVVLTKSTTYLVNNPKRLVQAYPDFPKFGAENGKLFTARDIDVSKFSADEKAALRTMKRKLAREKASHPLRKALREGGDAGLMAAAMNGAGDITVIRTVVIPKVAITQSGELRVPVVGPDGVKMATRKKGPKPTKRVAPRPGAADAPQKLTKERLQPRRRGVDRSRSVDKVKEIDGAKVQLPFVTGFTESHGWSDRWSIGGWALKAVFKPSFGFYFGIRVPVDMSWKISPAYREVRSARKNGADKDITAKVTLTANPSDQEDEFYKKAGMPTSKIFYGREIVSGVWASVNIKLYVLGARVMNKTIGITEKKAKSCSGDAKYCFQYHLQPPWKKSLKISKGGQKKNFKSAALWVPASVTRSTTGTINLGLAKGKAYANVGLKFGGTQSKVKIDYRSVVDGQVNSKKTMTFTPSQSSKSFSFKVPRIKGLGDKKTKIKTYGFKLSNPRYKTTITGTPGLRLVAKYKGFWASSYSKVSWEHFIDGWRFNIFTAELGPHAGTKTSLDCSQCAQKVYKSMEAEEGLFGGL